MSTSIAHRSGTLLSASPPRIRPRLIEGRSNSSELCRANGSDSILRKTSMRLEHRVVAEPRRRPVGRDAADLEPQRQHSLGLDPDLQVGRLAGDREVADEAAVDEMVAAALGLLLGLLVADDPEPHPDPVLVAHRRGGQQHRRQRPLHVVGAAPVEPVALDPRLELARRARGRRRGGRAGRRSAPSRARPRPSAPAARGPLRATTSIPRASSQPLTNPAASSIASGSEVS